MPSGSVKANRVEETAAALVDIDHKWWIYSDGGCDGNGAKGHWGAAGWGAHILAVNAEGEKEKVEAELWGPIETDPGSSWWCGAQRGTNSTGELMGIGQALIWLRDLDKTVRRRQRGAFLRNERN